MKIEQAIQKAMEGGYKHPAHFGTTGKVEQLLLDPSFWQSLGKAMGWADRLCIQCADENDGEPMYCEVCDGGDSPQHHSPQSEWLYRWHSFIDHLADGGSIEEWFKTL